MGTINADFILPLDLLQLKMFCDATRVVVLEHAEQTHRSLLSNMSEMGSQVFLSATER